LEQIAQRIVLELKQVFQSDRLLLSDNADQPMLLFDETDFRRIADKSDSMQPELQGDHRVFPAFASDIRYPILGSRTFATAVPAKPISSTRGFLAIAWTSVIALIPCATTRWRIIPVHSTGHMY
jgi:hypothetical protein